MKHRTLICANLQISNFKEKTWKNVVRKTHQSQELDYLIRQRLSLPQDYYSWLQPMRWEHRKNQIPT